MIIRHNVASYLMRICKHISAIASHEQIALCVDAHWCMLYNLESVSCEITFTNTCYMFLCHVIFHDLG